MSEHLNNRRAWSQGTPKPEPEQKKYQLKRTPIKKKPGKPKPRQKSKPKQYSKKRQALNRLYAAKSKPIWQDAECGIKAPGCTFFAQGIHHLKGKATEALLMDEKYWIPACNCCNEYVEKHDAWARENGFKLSKFN